MLGEEDSAAEQGEHLHETQVCEFDVPFYGCPEGSRLSCLVSGRRHGVVILIDVHSFSVFKTAHDEERHAS